MITDDKKEETPVSAGCLKPGHLGRVISTSEGWRGLRGAGVQVGPHAPALSTQRILEDKEENPLPAALVQPSAGKLCWFLDEAAARLLTVPFEKHSTL